MVGVEQRFAKLLAPHLAPVRWEYVVSWRVIQITQATLMARVPLEWMKQVVVGVPRRSFANGEESVAPKTVQCAPDSVRRGPQRPEPGLRVEPMTQTRTAAAEGVVRFGSGRRLSG